MVHFDDLALVLRELERLTAGGRPLPPALRAAAGELGRKPQRDALAAVAAACEDGTPLAEAFRAQQAHFPDPLPALVEAGVAAGDLPGMLGVAAEHCEAEARLRRSLRQALTYPVVTLAICILVALSAGWIVAAVSESSGGLRAGDQGVMSMFKLQGAIGGGLWGERPRDATRAATTSLYVAILGHPLRTALVLLVVAVLGWLAVRFAVRSPRVRGRCAGLAWWLPWVGPIYRTGVSARFLGTLGRLWRAGVPQDRSIALCEKLFPVAPVAQAARELRERTAEGAAARDSLGTSPLVPASVVWLLAGRDDETGLPEALLDAARTQRERHERLARTSKLVWGPFLQIVTGVLVFLLMTLLLTPLATAYLAAPQVLR